MTASGIVIDTARLRLRPFREDDLGELVRLIGSWEVARWVEQITEPVPIITKDLANFVSQMLKSPERLLDEPK